MKTIVLTGMMGSGKSTVGILLAGKLGVKFEDLDVLIEQKEKLSISEIFKTKGEFYFRQVEKDTIFEILEKENQIIALGGGAFENPQIQDFLLKNSTVIYLKTSSLLIFERIKNDNSRPLLCGNMSVDKIDEILKIRENNYNKAEYIISTDAKTKDEVVSEILGVLNL